MIALKRFEAWEKKVLDKIRIAHRLLDDQEDDMQHLIMQIDEAFYELQRRGPGRYPFGLERIFIRAEIQVSRYGRLRKQRGILEAMMHHNQQEIFDLESDIDDQRAGLNWIFHEKRKQAAREVGDILGGMMMEAAPYDRNRVEEVLYNWNELGSISTERDMWDRQDEDLLADYTQWLEGRRHHRRWDLRQGMVD
jgi:hypothetical protein